MSSTGEKINIWVPAVVVGLLISLLGACIYDLCRRTFWTFWAQFFPCIRRAVGLDQDLNLPNNNVLNPPNRNSVEQEDLVVNRNLAESMRSPIVNELLRSSDTVQLGGHSISNDKPASISNGNTIGPTHETIDMEGTHHDTEGRVSVVKGPVKPPDVIQPGGHSSINEEPASSSNVNTKGPTQDEIIQISKNNHDSEERVSLMDSTSQYVEDNIASENSDTFGHDATIRSINIKSNLEHVDGPPSTWRCHNKEASNSRSSEFTCNNPLELDNFPYAHNMDSTPSSNSSSSMFVATLHLAECDSLPFVSNVKEQLHNLAHREIQQWKSSVILQVPLSTDPVVLAKAVKLLKYCVEVDKSCTLQLGTWGILYFKGTSFTNFILTFLVLYYL